MCVLPLFCCGWCHALVTRSEIGRYAVPHLPKLTLTYPTTKQSQPLHPYLRLWRGFVSMMFAIHRPPA